MERLTPSQVQVLTDLAGTPGNLEDAFEHFRLDRPRLPFMVADRAFTKTLEALERRKLIERRDGYYHPTTHGECVVAAHGR